MHLRVTVVNLSRTIKTAAFNAAVKAIGRQVREHFAPEWNVRAKLRSKKLNAKGEFTSLAGLHDAIIYVGDESQDSTTGVDHMYGYHWRNAKNVPYGFVYLDICAQRGEPWTCTLSHEVLELLVDPSAALNVVGPAPRNRSRSVSYGLEVCDPVMGDVYFVNRLPVSNFVTPAYFKMAGGAPATNFLKLPLRPFGIRPGGYVQYDDKGKTRVKFGRKAGSKLARARRRKVNELMKHGRRNFRRTARLRKAK